MRNAQASVLAKGLALASVLLVAACSSTKPPEPRALQCTLPDKAGPAPSGPALVSQSYGVAITPIPLNAVVFNDDATARNVAVQAVYSSRTEGGTVEVSVRLVNCLDRPAMVRARTTFLAKSTAPVEPATAWHSVALPARATAAYSERSIARDEVGAFFVEIGAMP